MFSVTVAFMVKANFVPDLTQDKVSPVVETPS